MTANSSAAVGTVLSGKYQIERVLGEGCIGHRHIVDVLAPILSIASFAGSVDAGFPLAENTIHEENTRVSDAGI